MIPYANSRIRSSGNAIAAATSSGTHASIASQRATNARNTIATPTNGIAASIGVPPRAAKCSANAASSAETR